MDSGERKNAGFRKGGFGGEIYNAMLDIVLGLRRRDGRMKRDRKVGLGFRKCWSRGGVEILSDHVHFLVSASPRIAPSQIVQILKSVSTKYLFENYKWLGGKYWGGEIWAGGYFVRSVESGLTKAAVERYLKEQSEER